MDSLWGDEFVVAETPIQTKKLINKINNPKKPPTVVAEKAIKSKSVSIFDKLAIIKENVLSILGVYANNTTVIKTKQELIHYIDVSIKNGVISVDTETNNSLDPITCKIMGACIYTPGMQNAYIPINHVDPSTGERLSWQLSESDIKEQFERLIPANTKIITHNGKFDFEVLKCTCDVELPLYWDTLLGARILNENERAGLKQQYIEKIDPSIQKYDIEHLFTIEYALVDPAIFALYAATDAMMTYKLYEWQKRQFELPENERIYYVFKEIEMKVIPVVADMELTGIQIDTDYSKRLSDKYHKKLDALEEKIQAELSQYKEKIDKWRLTSEAQEIPITGMKNGETTYGKSKNEQLKDPVELGSPTQLAILLYDVLKVKSVDKKTPRGTGEEILLKINEKYKISLCDLILQKRGLEKLINTYIDKLPECVSSKDNRLHAHFNQIGADTGRFSSSDPNLQNIPSHEKSIRMMFTAAPGCVLVGSDFSQQEPRLLSSLSRDESMINAYKQGKDLYATIATGVYHNGYWDNMEHYEDGTANPEGKKRRGNCKKLLLGIMYGMGAASIAESISSTIEEAQTIIDNFYKGFPTVKDWMDKSVSNAKKNGFVEDVWGRRRRLPDIQLPAYSAEYINKSIDDTDFNPLIGSANIITNDANSLKQKYYNLAMQTKNKKELDLLIQKALADGISLHSNSNKIAQAERQCVNARIQGSAASMSKKAMIKVFNDEIIKKLGFKILIAVHDELIGECPEENAEKVAERLTEIMKHAAEPDVVVPFKCDPTIEKCWYYSDYTDTLQAEYKKRINSGEDKNTVYKNMCESYCECTEEQIKKILDNCV